MGALLTFLIMPFAQKLLTLMEPTFVAVSEMFVLDVKHHKIPKKARFLFNECELFGWIHAE